MIPLMLAARSDDGDQPCVLARGEEYRQLVRLPTIEGIMAC